MFASQGIGRWDASFDGSYSALSLGHPYADSPYYSSDVSLKLWMEEDLIQFIDVEGRRRPGEDSFLFDQDWSQYNLAGILGGLGKPAYTALIAEIPADSGPHYYQLRLSYPSLGIEIWYLIAPLPLSNGGGQICFGFEYVNFIHLLLYVPERVADAPVGITPNHLDVYTPWQEMTGSEFDTFYETFRDTGEPECVDVEPVAP